MRVFSQDIGATSAVGVGTGTGLVSGLSSPLLDPPSLTSSGLLHWSLASLRHSPCLHSRMGLVGVESTSALWGAPAGVGGGSQKGARWLTLRMGGRSLQCAAWGSVSQTSLQAFTGVLQTVLEGRGSQVHSQGNQGSKLTSPA